jgi:hypothetical protein
LRAFQEGNSCLLSPGAPDSSVRISFLIWRSRPLQISSRWRTGHCSVHTGHCSVHTGHCPVPPSDRWLCHASCAESAADRWPGRLLAHRTVRCTTGQSGAPPDSPVIYSRTPLISSREQPVDSRRPGASDTVRCTTGQSGAPRPSCLWLKQSHLFSNFISPVSST